MTYIDQETAQGVEMFRTLTKKDQLAILDALREVIASRKEGTA